MAVAIEGILGILRERGIEPETDLEGVDLPGIGQVEEGEAIYSTSITEVFAEGDEVYPETAAEDERLNEWEREIGRVIDSPGLLGRLERGSRLGMSTPPEPHCAWYCPIHFYGCSWGIFIRESCILSYSIDVARFVNWNSIPDPFSPRILRQLIRSAFYILYLHEQFHHKVESLGLRFLIATGADRYRPYKNNIYRPSFLTSDCLEESLANAESYRRLNEERYARRIDKPIRDALRKLLKASFPLQGHGYAEAMRFLGNNYRMGLFKLQSQVLDGRMIPSTPPHHWSIAANVITSLMDITDDIYVILPSGAHPIFRRTSIDPGYTVSSRALIDALTRHHGYQPVPGGKGSHIKLTRSGAPNIHVPGNRPVLSPGVVKQALGAIGGYPISRLPDLLDGSLGRIRLRAQ